MAFEPKNLAVMAYAIGVTHLVYVSETDRVREIARAGYFDNNTQPRLLKGDWIFVNSAPDSYETKNTILVVNQTIPIVTTHQLII